MKKLIILLFMIMAGCVIEEYPATQKLPPPKNLRLSSANNGVSVRLDWEAPDSGIPDGYIVYFKSIYDSIFRPIDTTSALFDIVTPGDTTGYYYVRSYSFDLGVSDSSNVDSTIPVYTPPVEIYELDREESPLYYSAFGFDTTTGVGSLYPMKLPSHCFKIDFYMTDMDSGWGGPYYIISPDLVYRLPYDSSQIHYRCAFKHTGFYLIDENPMRNMILPDSTAYLNHVMIGSNMWLNAMYVAIYTQDGYYGLLKIDPLSVDTVIGKVSFEAYFQKVRGLRLIRHR